MGRLLVVTVLVAGCARGPLPFAATPDATAPSDLAAIAPDLVASSDMASACTGHDGPFAIAVGTTPVGEFSGRFAWFFWTNGDCPQTGVVIEEDAAQPARYGNATFFDWVPGLNLSGIDQAPPGGVTVVLVRGGATEYAVAAVQWQMDNPLSYSGTFIVTSPGWNLAGCFVAVHAAALDADCGG